MNERDQRTDPPVPEPTDDEDTEGHSLLSGELSAQINRDHVREAATYARDQANRRAIGKPRESLRKRLFGR
jgi:hypothetical protein